MTYKKVLAFYSLIITIYLFFRLLNLTSLPIFTDEAIYIRWAQLIKNVETLRFIPQTDGKQPLFMWLLFPLLKIDYDPLFLSRLTSVLYGLGTLITGNLLISLLQTKEKRHPNPIFFLLSSIKNLTWVNSIYSSLTIANTYSFLFDRLATPDNLLTFLLVLSSLLALLQSYYNRLDIGLVLGFVLGLAWLTKSPAPVFYILISFFLYINNKKSLALCAISGLVMYGLYNILRLGPQFHMIALRNADYVWPYSHILASPFDPLKPHFIAFFDVITRYIGIILVFVGLVFGFKQKKLLLLPTLLCFVPLFGVLGITKVYTSRYTVFVVPFLLIIVSFGWSNLIKNKFFLILFTSLVFFQLYKTSSFLISPFTHTLAKNDNGYHDDWTSGWGLSQISQYLGQRSKIENNIIVGAEGGFGNPKDALSLYLDGYKNITITSQPSLVYSIPESLKKAKEYGDSVYMVYNSNRYFITSETEKLEILQKYPKPDGTFLLLIKLK